MGSSAGLLQRCLATGKYTEAQQWQQLLQQWWLWPLAQMHGVDPAGVGGCPASWLGVQGSHAERAAARRCVGPGADLIGLASSPPQMLHFCGRALFIFLFMSVPFLLSSFEQLRSLFAMLKPQILI